MRPSFTPQGTNFHQKDKTIRPFFKQSRGMHSFCSGNSVQLILAMRRLFTATIFFLFTVISSAQSDKYNLFKETRNQGDTLSMRRMLHSWGEDDDELYSAWAGYCMVKAETDGKEWEDRALEWTSNGRKKYPESTLLRSKSMELLFSTGHYPEAQQVMREILSAGNPDDGDMSIIANLYLLKSNPDSAIFYLKKLTESSDKDISDYGKDVIREIEGNILESKDKLIVPDHKKLRQYSRTAEFKTLVNRFKRGDKNFTLKELSDIYYGSAFGKNYQLVSMNQAKAEGLYYEGKYREALKELESILEEYPISLRTLYNCFLCKSALGEDTSAYLFKLQSLLGSIVLSGDGTSPKTPYHVICADDEYLFLNEAFRMKSFLGQILNNDNQDEMTFINSYGLEQTTFFELSPAYWEKIEGLLE